MVAGAQLAPAVPAKLIQYRLSSREPVSIMWSNLLEVKVVAEAQVAPQELHSQFWFNVDNNVKSKYRA